MRKSFKYRCYPNKGTRKRAFKAFKVFGRVWSNAASERSRAYFQYRDAVFYSVERTKKEMGKDLTEKEISVLKKSVGQTHRIPTFYDQYALIRKRDLPDDHDYHGYDAQSLQDVLHKLDASFKSYRKLRENGHPDAMPPNQKRLHRCITYRQSGWRIEGSNLFLSHIGKFRLRLHRPIEGKIKTVSVTEKNGKWYASFSCEADEFSRACRPLSVSKSCVPHDLQQEYTSTGGSNPEKGGTDNRMLKETGMLPGGSNPEKGGTDNTGIDRRERIRGGSNPEKGGTDNNYINLESLAVGGSNPEKGGTDNINMFGVWSNYGGSDPESIEIRFMFSDGLFLTDNHGGQIAHPEFYFSDISTLRRLSRSLSRKAPGSRNRKKARRTLAKWHDHIANKRKYFLWQIALYYASRYRKVTIPRWPLKQKIHYAVDSRAAQVLCDGSYGLFVQMLKFKCQEYHTELIERKDTLWESEIKQLTDNAKRETLKKVLWKTRKAVKWNSLERFRFLKAECEQLTTLRIC